MTRLLSVCLAIGIGSTAILAAAAPVEVVDAIGRKVVVDAPARRVVICFNYEEFTAVAGRDAWTRVVGMSKTLWSEWRPAIFARYVKVIPNLADLPDVGNTEDGNFSAERVLGLKPDVVLMAEWSFAALKTARDQIETAGIPIVVIDYNAQLLERHLASTRAIGRVMGTQARGEELAALYEREYQDILRRVARARGARTRVYVELGRDGADTIGNTYNNTMWGKIITLLGAENVATGRLPGPWGPLNAEAVIAADPAVVLIAGSSWVNRPKAVRLGYDMTPELVRRSLEPYAARPGWSNLAAVRRGEVHAIEHGLARTLFDYTAMQYIGKRLYPEQFADVDPERSLREYHERYLPVPFSGIWFLPLKP